MKNNRIRTIYLIFHRKLWTHLAVAEAGKVGCDKKGHSFSGSLQKSAVDEQNEENEVGHSGCDVNNLSGKNRLEVRNEVKIVRIRETRMGVLRCY